MSGKRALEYEDQISMKFELSVNAVLVYVPISIQKKFPFRYIGPSSCFSCCPRAVQLSEDKSSR